MESKVLNEVLARVRVKIYWYNTGEIPGTVSDLLLLVLFPHIEKFSLKHTFI